MLSSMTPPSRITAPPPRASRREELYRRRFRQSLLQVGDDVLHLFDAYRQANDVRPGAGGDPLLVGELAVRGRGGVDDQALGIADIGNVGEQIDAVDHLHADLVAALDAEGEDRAGALRQVLPGERIVLVRRQA